MRKKLVLTTILAIFTLTMAACGDIGNRKIDDPLVEGDGPAFNLTRVGDVELLLDSIIITDVYSLIKGAYQKDTSRKSEEVLQTLCEGNSYSESHILEVGRGGKGLPGVLMEGLYSVTASPDLTNIDTTANIETTFTDFFSKLPSRPSSLEILLTGTVTLTDNLIITDSNIYQEACNGQDINNDATGLVSSIEINETVSGNLSISGDIGGAISFNWTAHYFTLDPKSETTPELSVSGMVTILSGGQTATCRIDYNKDLIINCE